MGRREKRGGSQRQKPASHPRKACKLTAIQVSQGTEDWDKGHMGNEDGAGNLSA